MSFYDWLKQVTGPSLKMTLKAACTVDFVKVHGRPPLTAEEFTEHYAKWMRGHGKAIERLGRKTLKGTPTTLESVIATALRRAKK